MKQRIKDKIHLLAWNLDKYIKEANIYETVNNKPIEHHDLNKAARHRKYVRRLYKDICDIGYENYRITREELLELNDLYTRYRIDLDQNNQSFDHDTPPSVSSRLLDR